MQCMILFPGRDGRLPSVEEMRRAGFVLSTALGQAQDGAVGAGVALAAEPPARFAEPCVLFPARVEAPTDQSETGAGRHGGPELDLAAG